MDSAFALLRDCLRSDEPVVLASLVEVTTDDFVRVLAWYDNEWAYSNRMVDTAVAMGDFL